MTRHEDVKQSAESLARHVAAWATSCLKGPVGQVRCGLYGVQQASSICR